MAFGGSSYNGPEMASEIENTYRKSTNKVDELSEAKLLLRRAYKMLKGEASITQSFKQKVRNFLKKII